MFQIADSSEPTSRINMERLSFYRDPSKHVVMAGYGAPDYGFKESGSWWPVFDIGIRDNNLNLLKTGKADEITKSPYLGEFYNIYQEWWSKYSQGGDQKLAAMTSSDHTAVQILNVHAEVFGRRERAFTGKNLCQMINIPNLVIDFDTLKKYGYVESLAELQIPKPKILKYTRQHVEAQKVGLIFETSEEDQLKLIHNPHQDGITIASAKIEARASFDAISTLQNNLTTQAGTDWSVFDAGTNKSTNNPQDDLGIAELNIGGTGIAGKMNKVGMHPLTLSKWNGNTFNKGQITPTDNAGIYEPGTSALLAYPGVGLVRDQMITQGQCIAVSTEVEPCCAYLQGPQRVAAEHNQITGSDVYGIFDFHAVSIINSLTGRLIQNIATPKAW